MLQFLSSRYVGLEFNGKRYLTEIDLNTVSNAAIADCLKFAGYDAALAAVKAQLKGRWTRKRRSSSASRPSAMPARWRNTAPC